MISLRKARTIVRKAMEKGTEDGMKPLSVVVLDAGGHVQAFERADGAAPGRFAIAHGKAYGSVMLGMAGTAQMARARGASIFHECRQWRVRRAGYSGAGWCFAAWQKGRSDWRGWRDR